MAIDRDTLETSLNVRTHDDPDRHWIGGSLPMPSSSHAKANSTTTDVGKSAFPARADHSHDIDILHGRYYMNVALASPGGGVRSYVNNWVHSGGEDFRSGGSQLFVPSVPGMYEIGGIVRLTRPTAMASTYLIWEIALANAGTIIPILRYASNTASNFDIKPFRFSVASNAVSPFNLQFSTIVSSAIADISFRCDELLIKRIGPV